MLRFVKLFTVFRLNIDDVDLEDDLIFRQEMVYSLGKSGEMVPVQYSGLFVQKMRWVGGVYEI